MLARRMASQNINFVTVFNIRNETIFNKQFLFEILLIGPKTSTTLGPIIYLQVSVTPRMSLNALRHMQTLRIKRK